ncbi:MAG: protein translocase SEC61 complex subunit gamma [Nanoarchaeota archaeon]
MQRIKSFLAQCKRVWTVLKKPTRQEFNMISKISALGILAIGLVGFLIMIIMRVFG